MDEFINKIYQTLKDHGYPDKRVSLPTEKMYEAADKRGLSFNKVLEQMQSAHGVESQITADKIIFSQKTMAHAGGMSQEELMRSAQEMMSKMDPEELRKLQEQFMNMTPEQKEEILKKGKDLGII